MSLADYYKSLETKQKPDPKVKENAASELAGIPLPELKKKNKGLFHTLLDILDRPGNAARGLLIGKAGGLKGLIPFAQKIEDLTGIDIALNEEDLTTGNTVAEKWFGVKNTKGKLDLNDILGLGIEIAADPLWLVGGAGAVTGAGKLAKLASSSAKAVGGIEKLRAMAKAGELTGKHGKKIAKYLNEGGEELATGWANQAAKGQRAMLSIAGKPIIKGEKAIGKYDDWYTAWKQSNIGKTFYRPTERLSSKFSQVPVAETVNYDKALATKAAIAKEIQGIYDNIPAGMDKNWADEQARKLIELQGTDTGTRNQIYSIMDEASRRGTKAEKGLLKKIEQNQERLSHLIPRKELRQQRIEATSQLKGKKRFAKHNYALGQLDKQIDQLQKQLARDTSRLEQVQNFTKLGYKKGGQATKKLQSALDVRDFRTSQISELEQQLGDKLPAVQGVADQYTAKNKELLNLSRSAGSGLGEFTDTGYGHRMPSKQGKEYIRKEKLRAGAGAGHEASRLKQWEGLTTEEAELEMKRAGFKGENYFEKGMADPTLELATQTANKAAQRQTLIDTIKQYGGADGRPVQKLLDMYGIDAKSIGLDINQRLPEQVYDAMVAMKNEIPSESSLAALEGTVRPAVQWWKGAQTSIWPSFHVRNAMSNAVQSFQGGVANPVQTAKAFAMRVMGKPISIQSPTKLYTSEEINKLASELGVFSHGTGQLSMEEAGIGGIEKAGKTISKALGRNNPAFKAGRKVGNAVEDTSRLTHFLDGLEKGLNPVDAAMEAKKYLFDYNNLSSAEKRIRDAYIPFYTYSRKNIPLQLETLAQQPAKQAIWSHLMGGTPEIQGNDKSYPDWWRERLVSKPVDLDGGKQMRVAGFGVPLEDLGSFAGAGTSATDSIGRIAQRQFTRLSPAITAPVEAITGKDIFYGRDISDTGYAPNWAKYAPEFVKKPMGIKEVQSDKGGSYYIMNPQVRWAISKSPASRAWSSSNMIADDSPTYATVSNMVSGIKPRIYDPAKLESQARKEQAKELLDEEFRQGNVKRYLRYYKPKTKDIDEQKAQEIELLLKSQK